MLLFFKITEVI